MCYLAALKNIGITQNNTKTEFETAPCPPDNYYSNWAQCPDNNRFGLGTEINIELQKLYMRGKGIKNKNTRITAQKTYDILN